MGYRRLWPRTRDGKKKVSSTLIFEKKKENAGTGTSLREGREDVLGLILPVVSLFMLRFFLLLFGRFVNLHYLCGRKKQSIMKDIDKESRFNEEENVGMTAEPIGAAVRSEVSSLGYNIDNWPGMPLVGPDNVEEMNARIDLAEQEIDNNNGFSWEQVMTDAQSIVNRYAATVY